MNTQEMIEGAGFRPTREEVHTFIVEQVIGVISTLDETGAPMSATVAVSVTKDGDFLVGTSEASAKSRNVEHDARVAITVTDADRRHTLQLQGAARKLPKEIFEADYADEHYRQRPQSLPFRDTPGQCHILIHPTRMKFSDVSVYPWVVTEY